MARKGEASTFEASGLDGRCPLPIISHTVFRDALLEHLAWVDFRPACVPQRLSPRSRNWTWVVEFRDLNGDGAAEVLQVQGFHLVAAHTGEAQTNRIGTVLLPEPCRSRAWLPVIVDDGHGSHLDRMFIHMKRLTKPDSRTRIYIGLQHQKPGAPLEVPVFGDGGGLLGGGGLIR